MGDGFCARAGARLARRARTGIQRDPKVFIVFPVSFATKQWVPVPMEPKPIVLRIVLEAHLERHLDVTRIVAGACDLTHVRPPSEVAIDIPGAAIDGVVERVEEIGTQLSPHPLKAEFLADSEIQVLSSRLTKTAVVLRLIAVLIVEGLTVRILTAAHEAAITGRREGLECVVIEPMVLVTMFRFGIAHEIG